MAPLEHLLFRAFVQYHGIPTDAGWSGVRGKSNHTPPYEVFLTSARQSLDGTTLNPSGVYFIRGESHLLLAPLMADDSLVTPAPGDTHRVDYGRLRFDGTGKSDEYLAHYQDVAKRCTGEQREFLDRLVQAWRDAPQRNAIAVPDRLIAALTPELVTDVITLAEAARSRR